MRIAGSHASEISVPLNQDGISAIAGRRNGGANAAGTAAHYNYVAFADHINPLVGLRNCSDYVCHFASSIIGFTLSRLSPPSVCYLVRRASPSKPPIMRSFDPGMSISKVESTVV